MTSRPVPDDAPLSPAESIAGMVDPIRSAGALLGFAVGAVSTWRLGGGLTDCVLHGLLGALLLFPIAWFLGLLLVREMIRANVEEQREDYDRRVAEAKRSIAQQYAASGTPLPPALREHARGLDPQHAP